MHAFDVRQWLTFKTRQGRWTALGGAAVLLLVGVLVTCQREHDKLLRQFETSTRSEVRARALGRIGEMGREEDLPVFFKAARDPSARVRRAAALGLAQTRHASAVDPLGELLNDSDHDVQAGAAAGLATFGSEKSRAYLLNGYGRLDGPARKAIAAAVGPSGVADAIRHEAKMLWERNVKALDSGGLAERVGAVEELGRSGRGEAVERLLPLLGDDSVLFAAGAARGLAAARDPRALIPLSAALKDSFPGLREAAADALGALGDPAAVPALKKKGLEGGPGAVAAVRALGMLGASVDGRAALCTLASEGDPEVAGHAARLMRERGGCSLERVTARLGRGGLEMRAALAALEGLGGNAGTDRVAALLEGGDLDVRTLAARALAEMDGGASAAAKVLRQLDNEVARRAEQRKKAAGAAAESAPATATAAAGAAAGGGEGDGADSEQGGTAKTKQMLAKVQALDDERGGGARPGRGLPELDEGASDDELLLALVRAAGRLRPDGAAESLSKLTSDRGGRVRAAACEAVCGMGGSAAQEAAARCLDDRSPVVVRATARGLVRAGGGASIAAVAAALDRRSAARGELLRALGELKAAAEVGRIAAALADGGPDAVDAAVALGRIGEPSAVPALNKALQDPTCPARLEIIDALGKLGDPKGVEAVRLELYSERPDIRAAAARALGRLGYRDRSGTLDALRFDYYADVRRAAEEALGTPGRAGLGTRE